MNYKSGLIISKNNTTQMSEVPGFVYSYTPLGQHLQFFLLPQERRPDGDEQSPPMTAAKAGREGRGRFLPTPFSSQSRKSFSYVLQEASPSGHQLWVGWPGRCEGSFEMFLAFSTFVMEGEFS